jgi:hypothetical protein
MMKAAAAQPALAEGGMRGITPRMWDAIAVVALLVVTLPWWWVVKVPFILFDDEVYITQNPDVLAGLTPASIGAAFTTGRGAMWIPLTWLSFMLDVTLFGKEPWGFHLTNVALHVANGLLVYAFLRVLTGSPVRSVIAALLWVMHPLRVESVAWATERKDVLSLFFGLLALIAYVKYARLRGSGANGGRLIGWYASVGVLLACSLMAKPMMVTLPCVMLLLDFWPLGRWSGAVPVAGAKGKGRAGGRWMVLAEKVPLLAISGAIAAATLLIPVQQSMLVTTEQRPLGTRMASALAAYLYTFRDNFYFEKLSFFYPLRGVPAEECLLAAVVLIGLTAGAVWLAMKKPEVGRPALIGWLWYLGALVPTSGLFQIGSQSRADRFSYYPAIGLTLALVWVWPGAWFREQTGKLVAGLVSGGAALVLTTVMYGQLSLWVSPFELYRESAQRSAPNYLMEFMVGKMLQDGGDLKEAAAWYITSIESKGNYPLSHYNFATILVKMDQLEAARQEFHVAYELDPKNETLKEGVRWVEAEVAKRRGGQ